MFPLTIYVKVSYLNFSDNKIKADNLRNNPYTRVDAYKASSTIFETVFKLKNSSLAMEYFS